VISSLRDCPEMVKPVANFVIAYLEKAEFAKDMPIECDTLCRFLDRTTETMDVEVLFSVGEDGAINGVIGVYVDELPFNSFLWGFDLFFAATNPIAAKTIVDRALNWLRNFDRVIGATFGINLGIDNDRASRFLCRMGLEETGKIFVWRK